MYSKQVSLFHENKKLKRLLTVSAHEHLCLYEIMKTGKGEPVCLHLHTLIDDCGIAGINVATLCCHSGCVA